MAERVALIGYGAIGAAVHRLLLEHAGNEIKVVSILVRNRERLIIEVPQEASLLVDKFDVMMESQPTLVVECAGHQAVDEYGADVLIGGVDLLMVSVGALADPARELSLITAAQISQSKLLLPSGAIGGIDWLTAARMAGLREVTYRSRKAPHAWAGRAADEKIDLEGNGGAALFFKGSARDAALQYPRNANVAATVALATLGFDATRVELISDPNVRANIHEIEAVGSGGRMTLRLEGVPDFHNPRTSVMTAYSVVRSILNRHATMVM